MRQKGLRLRAALYRMRWPLAGLGAWFLASALAFRWLGGQGWADALLSAFYLQVGDGPFAQGYSFWGQSLVFGVVLGLLLREVLENYTERCRLMAGMLREHTIIVGYSHLGARLVAHCLERGSPYVLIEKDRHLVDDLLRRGEPVVVDDARTPDALPAANVKAAKRLIIACNDVETALIVTKTAREANPSIFIAARCPVDGLIGVLQKLGADYVYSASLAAYNDITKALAL